MGLDDSPRSDLDTDASAQDDGESESGAEASQSKDPAEGSQNEDPQKSEQNPDRKCGNGIVEPPEACDDANDIDSDDCLSNCELPRCGDGFIWEGHEECEQDREDLRPRCKELDLDEKLLHNPESPLGCDSECKLSPESCAYCGDDVLQGRFGELCEGALACNDPRIDARYYDSEKILAECAIDCRTIDASACGFCGDGVIQEWEKERCDDANLSINDSCPQCQPARCGDGFVWTDHEDCDPGSPSSASQVSSCAESCGKLSEEIFDALPPSRTCVKEGEEACRWGPWDCRGCRAP